MASAAHGDAARAAPDGDLRQYDRYPPRPGARLRREWRGRTSRWRSRRMASAGRTALPRALGGRRARSPAPAGTGPRFFGLRRPGDEQAGQALRALHPQELRGGAGAGLQQPRCPARGLRRLRQEPGQRRLAGCSTTRYDDGGFSGGSMERPALQRLLADIAAGKVDLIVVYKIDRLTRSLADFAASSSSSTGTRSASSASPRRSTPPAAWAG